MISEIGELLGGAGIRGEPGPPTSEPSAELLDEWLGALLAPSESSLWRLPLEVGLDDVEPGDALQTTLGNGGAVAVEEFTQLPPASAQQCAKTSGPSERVRRARRLSAA